MYVSIVPIHTIYAYLHIVFKFVKSNERFITLKSCNVQEVIKEWYKRSHIIIAISKALVRFIQLLLSVAFNKQLFYTYYLAPQSMYAKIIKCNFT